MPDGFYQLVLTHSPRFGRTLPLLRHVPHFEGVRIHAGNTVHDTQGCILVGQALAPGRLRASRAALERLMRLLERGADSAIDIRTCLPAGPPPDRSAP
ncbi:MAG: hypothetical protein ILA34_05950 [Bacteroidaceae bacterium]|nr:hypothetical protein [Bacteroidaceae bacterium]